MKCKEINIYHSDIQKYDVPYKNNKIKIFYTHDILKRQWHVEVTLESEPGKLKKDKHIF